MMQYITPEEYHQMIAPANAKSRKKATQDEQQLQAALVEYVMKQYPQAIYKGDPFNGLIDLPIQLAVKAKKMGNRRAWPDFTLPTHAEDTPGCILS